MNFKKWRFFTWTRDNHAAFAEAVAAELDDKPSKKAVDMLIAEALSQSGGTITKPVIIDLPPTRTSPEYPITFKVKYKETSGGYIWRIGISSVGTTAYIQYGTNTNLIGISPVLGLFPANSNYKNFTLGYYNSHWPNVYADKLNNGEDIEIPNKAGTLALVSDIEDILRKYGLIPNETQPTEQPTEKQG